MYLIMRDVISLWSYGLLPIIIDALIYPYDNIGKSRSGREASVNYCTKAVNPSLIKPPLKFNGGLDKIGSFVSDITVTS